MGSFCIRTIDHPIYKRGDIIKMKNKKNDTYVIGYIVNIEAKPITFRYYNKWTIDNVPEYIYIVIVQKGSYYNSGSVALMDVGTIMMIPEANDIKLIKMDDNDIRKYPNVLNIGGKVIHDEELIKKHFMKVGR